LSDDSALESDPDRRALVIAHRGASGYLPENTMAAYALAIEQQADMIEIDLHLTRDEAIVISHNAGLEHLDAEGEIAERSLKEIRRLNAGASHGREDPVPTLDEVLDSFGARIPFNLEIKQALRGGYRGIEAAALSAVEQRGLLGGTLFSSFYDPVLAALRERSSAARLGVLVDPRRPQGIFERARRVLAEAINPHFVLATPELVDEAHAEGLAVHVYTVDDPAQMKALLDAGVDGIFTNRPDTMRSVLRGEATA
jgi:glycerophosphoryl diester phosphodiesterase